MRLPLRLLLPTLGAILQVACIDDGTGTSTSSSSGSTAADGGDASTSTAAGRACLDTADAFAKAQVRCSGGDLAAARSAFIRTLANGDCETVTIRNERELRTGCLPVLATIACEALTNGRLPPPCAGQILSEK